MFYFPSVALITFKLIYERISCDEIADIVSPDVTRLIAEWERNKTPFQQHISYL